MSITRQRRAIPAIGSGTPGVDFEYLPSVPFESEPVEGWTGGDLPTSPAAFIHGYQARAAKVAKQVSTAGALYPDDGTGTTAASASSGQTAIKLAANVLQTQDATLTPVGLLLAGRYATAPDLWEVVRVTAWTSGTQTVTANRNLTNTWPSGAKYVLLYDVRGAEQVHVLSEFSADPTAMTVNPVLFDWSGKVRTHVTDVVLVNSAITGATAEVEETSYRYGFVRSIAVRGFLGAKVRVKSVSNGNASLWLARS